MRSLFLRVNHKIRIKLLILNSPLFTEGESKDWSPYMTFPCSGAVYEEVLGECWKFTVTVCGSLGFIGEDSISQ